MSDEKDLHIIKKESNMSAEKAREKNIEEYNQTADAYEQWANTNLLMQNYCYYSTIHEIEKEGIEGKTYLEVGCGPCPIGQMLAKRGAKKIYGLDISSSMIEIARANLTELGIIDKFELVCADIFDTTFKLPEKVDCVVLSYTLTTFINNLGMLTEILRQCKKQLKEGGHICLTDFEYVKIPKEEFWCGMYTSDKCPEVFQPFQFYIDKQPDAPFDIFHIPVHTMYEAGIKAGFKQVVYRNQYPDPEHASNPIMIRYLEECKPTDYILKFIN